MRYLLPIVIAVCGIWASEVQSAADPSLVASCSVEQSATGDELNGTINLYPVESRTSLIGAGWSIDYQNTYKIISNSLVDEQYVLYKRGTNRPSPISDSKIRVDAKYFESPLKQVAVDETVSLTYMELLGLRSNIQFVDASLSSSACIQQMNELSLIGPLSAETSSYGGNSTLRALQITQVDAVLAGNSPSANNKTIAFSATLAAGTLQRASWIEFMAALFDREFAGQQLYKVISQRYLSLTQQVQDYLSNGNTKPLVAFVENASYAPSGAYRVSFAEYKRQFVEDAGGQIFIPSNSTTGAIQVSATAIGWNSSTEFQQVLLNAGVDSIIDETYYVTFPQNASAVLQGLGFETPQIFESSPFRFIASKNIWREDGTINRNGALDWFENGVVQSDSVLADFIGVCQPSVLPQHNQRWIRRVAAGNGPTILLDTCPNYKAPSQLFGSPAVDASNFTCPGFLMSPALYSQAAANAASAPDLSQPTLNSQSSKPSNSDNTKMVIGLVVGLGCLVILLPLVVYLIMQSKRKNLEYAGVEDASNSGLRV